MSNTHRQSDRPTPVLETDPRFKSGRYRGFYLQFGRRSAQEMTLTFVDGRASGWGCDPTGRFDVTGTYDTERGRALWTKHYPGRHTVHYDVTAEMNNGLWGLWQIRGFFGDRGGFQLWPVGGPGEAASKNAEADAPANESSESRELVQAGTQ